MRQAFQENVPETAMGDYMNSYIYGFKSRIVNSRIVQDRIDISERKCFG